MRYFRAKYEEYMEALTYRIYISDSLYYQTQGKGLTVRYIDLIHPKPEDNRTADEVANDIINRAGLKFE